MLCRAISAPPLADVQLLAARVREIELTQRVRLMPTFVSLHRARAIRTRFDHSDLVKHALLALRVHLYAAGAGPSPVCRTPLRCGVSVHEKEPPDRISSAVETGVRSTFYTLRRSGGKQSVKRRPDPTAT